MSSKTFRFMCGILFGGAILIQALLFWEEGPALYSRVIEGKQALITQRLTWQDLSSMESPRSIPAKLQEAGRVQMDGFMVPLEGDDESQVREFLLVPVTGMCIHVPPPPSNQTVYVKMKGVSDFSWEAISVFGKFFVRPQENEFNTAYYYMEGERVVPYDYDDPDSPYADYEE